MLSRCRLLQWKRAKLVEIPVLSLLHRSLKAPLLISSSSLSANSRHATSAASTRWKSRQSQDQFAREAKVQGLKSRAAFKLLQINDKYKIFRKGATVVDLGFAPGSWSQVAVNRTAPGGRVIGVDILPAQPPRGASSIQGNFLSPEIQDEVRAYVQDPTKGRPIDRSLFHSAGEAKPNDELDQEEGDSDHEQVAADTSYLDMQKSSMELEDKDTESPGNMAARNDMEHMSKAQRDAARGWVVDVVLSDMSEPWEQIAGFGKRSLSDPYFRLMNTSGMPFRDHAGSMDLCNAGLSFCYDTLRTGGHYVCKYYQGAEDKTLEKRLKRLFEKVHRDKPSASRSESKEGYFVALRRKAASTKDEVFAE